MQRGTIIVGTGQAGFQTAASLRANGYQEDITLIGEEPHIPYQRPPLSKGFLMGEQNLENIQLRPERFYQDQRINLLAGEKVIAIERSDRRLKLASGGTVSYDILVLAVGVRNRALSPRGAEIDGVLYLRSLDDAIVTKNRLISAQEITIIGGGFIGLEIAAAAASMGKSVTVVEALPRLMSRVVSPIISDFYCALHRERGVKILCHSTVSNIAFCDGTVRCVELTNRLSVPADLVIVGIGVVPNTELARDAGLSVGNGVSVNQFLMTEDQNIYAIGDCAEYPSTFAGGRIRLESVQNAADQAQCVAASIAGKRGRYEALPWFWTDQFGTKLQIAGISTGSDCVVTRGAPGTRRFSLFYFRRNQLIAVDSVNRPGDHVFARKLIASRVPINPEEVADESLDLKSLANREGMSEGHSRSANQ